MSENESLSLMDARRALFEQLSPITGCENVSLLDALGRVLFSDVFAPFDVPAHANSAMDGYALRFDDLPASGEARLSIVGTVLAGHAFSDEVGIGQAVRIMTGAVLPEACDTVVAQEDVRVEDSTVLVPAGQTRWQHVRPAGEDLAKGALALRAGKRLGPAEIGLLASLGIVEVSVFRRLRVAVFSTGDEIATPGQPLLPGQVYDSNRHTLCSLLDRLGAERLDMGVIPDDPSAIEKVLREASAQADAIVTSGGVSVGDADHVRALLGKLGDVRFWKVNIKPGKPMAFGRIGKAWLFGLPGNPVAVMVTFQQLVMDALLRLMGCASLPPRPGFSVPCITPFSKRHGRREFLRGVLFDESGQWKVRLTGNQGSGVLSSMSEANCFVVLPEGPQHIAAGDRVEVQPFDVLS